MNKRIALLALFAATGLAACQPKVVEVPVPMATPGPAGPPGASGSQGSDGATGATGTKGDTGATGNATAVIVLPAPASSPSN